jgi:prophage regulatory protein
MDTVKNEGKKGYGEGVPISAADSKGFEPTELMSLISKAVSDALTKVQAYKSDQAKPKESAVVSRDELKVLTGLGETTLWRLEKAGDFPVKLKLSTRRVGWMRHEIEAWIQARRVA